MPPNNFGLESVLGVKTLLQEITHWLPLWVSPPVSPPLNFATRKRTPVISISSTKTQFDIACLTMPYGGGAHTSRWLSNLVALGPNLKDSWITFSCRCPSIATPSGPLTLSQATFQEWIEPGSLSACKEHSRFTSLFYLEPWYRTYCVRTPKLQS